MEITVPDQAAFKRRLDAGIEAGMKEIADAVYDQIILDSHDAGDLGSLQTDLEGDLIPYVNPTYYLDKKMPYFMGQLKVGMKVEKIENGYAVKFPDYAGFIDEGREITVAEARTEDPKFREWEMAKGFVGKHKFSDYARIGRAHPFMEATIDKVMQMAPALMQLAIENSFKSNL